MLFSSICERMKLLVPLRMAWIDSIWLAVRHSLMAAMMGMPPATAASKAIERPNFRALSNSSGPCSASRALLAVITFLPLSNSFSTMVRAGSSPPTNSIAATISGLSVTLARSAVSTPGGRAKFRGRFRSGSTTWTSSTVCRPGGQSGRRVPATAGPRRSRSSRTQ